MKIVYKSRNIKSASNLLHYTARYWAELIEEIESEGYKVDSADRHKPVQWITAYKDGNEYEIEVTRYYDGTYEVVKADLVGSVRASTKTKVTASWDEDDSEWIKLNRKHVLDSDGFYTDYTLYTNGHEYICMFGDEDIYGPDPDYADFSTDSEEEAMEWFDSYEGMGEDIQAATDDELEHPDQEYDSAATSINSNRLPAIYKLVHFEPGKVYLDFGGGKFDNGVYYVRDLGATLLVYDPYNRSDEHNKEVLRVIKENGGADAALNSNVLNVIKEPEARLSVLKNIKKLTKPGGDVYITVYEGTGKGNEGPTKAGYQLNRKTADYLEEVQSVFPDAQRKGKLIHATNSGSVSSSRLIRSNCKITSAASASRIEIDAEDLRGLSRERIEQILDEAPVGAEVSHIRNLENRFNMDALIRKKQAYKSNYFNPVGAPGDFNNLDTYWTVGGYEDPYIDKTIYTAINGTNKYYGLTSEVLKAHGITSSVHFGDDNHTNLTICPYCHGDRFNDKIGLCLDCGYDEKSRGTGPYYDQEYEDDFDDYDHNYEPDQADWNDLNNITSASYGGAYDILDDYYFTRDDLIDFGADIEDYLEDIDHGVYFINDLDMPNPTTIHVEVYCRNREAYADIDVHIDMRRIRKSSDLNKYARRVANDLYDKFSEYDEVYGTSDYQVQDEGVLLESTQSDQYVPYDDIADYVHEHYSFEDIDDKYACINSLRQSFKGEGRVAKDIIEQFVGGHNGMDAVISANEVGYSSLQDSRLEPPEPKELKQVDNSIEEVEISLDKVIITVDEDGGWDYEDESYPWAANPNNRHGDWYSEDYNVYLDDTTGVVEKFDEIVELYIPGYAGRYQISCNATLVYNVSGVEVDRDYFQDEDGDILYDGEEVYTDDAEVDFDSRNSFISNFKYSEIN